MSDGKSYRQILRSSSIIGGASVVNIGIGLLRTKAAALLLGPAGVGLIGLFQNLVLTASSVASLGFGTVGTRQIAEAAGREDEGGVAAARRALSWGTWILAALGALAFWLLRGVLAQRILGDVTRADQVGWLAVGVILSVAAGSQTALLNGLRRIADIAKVSVASAVLSTLVGVGILWRWRELGLVAFVLTVPVATFGVGLLYVRRLPKTRGPRTPLGRILGEWRALAKLGAAFMVAGVVTTVGQLAVRTLVQRELGAGPLGQFQAAWAISMTYIGFVLTAMGTDYYPRLTAAYKDPPSANRMVNEQTEVALLLAGPVFLAMETFAPWVIDLLYSSRFHEAAEVLRWQVLGDVLKVASWPLGFLILASGDGRRFLFSDTAGMAVFVAGVAFGLPLLGVQATGLAFLAMYAAYLPLIHLLARQKTGFRWDPQVSRHLLALVTATLGLCLVSRWSEAFGVALGLPVTAAFGVYGFTRLGRMVELGGPLGRVAKMSQRGLTRLRAWVE